MPNQSESSGSSPRIILRLRLSKVTRVTRRPHHWFLTLAACGRPGYASLILALETLIYQNPIGILAKRGETVPAGRALSSGELAALLDSCEARPLGVRDAAIISLLCGCGLRRAELVALQMNDYIIEESALVIRGKGNKA